MQVLVVGLAATGVAVVDYTRAAGHAVTVLEDHPERPGFRERAEAAVAAGAEVVEAPDAAATEALARAADLVVPSPGVRPDHRALVAADAAGVPVRSEIDLGAGRLRSRPDGPRLAAVTGTNGKTTVTTLIDAMLRHAGIASTAAGNIGRPLLEAAGDAVAVVVAEVSSFQLACVTDAFAPDVAVLLNVAEDHLDWHGSVDAYAQAKAQLFAHQAPGATLVVNADDPSAAALVETAPAKVVWCSSGEPPAGGYGVVDGFLWGPGGAVAPIPSTGVPHDVTNALVSAAAAAALGADAAAIAAALNEFQGLAHRVELVGEIGGVRFYDDSKATNPHATASAVRGFDQVVLIAGGRNKALDLGVLRGLAPRLRIVVAIGEAAAEIGAAFAGLVPVVKATSMHDAVRAASLRAEPGDAVLLSPACASFDSYDSYAARGDDFAREVALLTEVHA